MTVSRLCALAIVACLAMTGGDASAAEPAPVPALVLDHVRAYVAAVNDEGEAAADAFREGHTDKALADGVPRAAFVNFFANQHRVSGGLELLDVRWRDADAVVALVRGRHYGAPVGVTLDLAPDGDRRVTNFDPAPAPAWTPRGAAVPASELGARAQALADRGCQAGVFSGAYLVARGPVVLAQGACGQANRRYGVANTVDSRINLGSMDKMFTAVAVMQLVEAGRVSLDDPLGKYADETWLPAAVSAKITIRQLLTHTSGLGSFLGAEFQRSAPTRFRELADYKPLVHGETPTFEPGSDYRYSNTGMLLLGVVIERASGSTYFDYVRDRIFRPAGMLDTGAWPLDEPVVNLAMGYGWAPGSALGWRENTLRSPYRGSPAGGGFSTVGDLHRFALALQDDRLISAASRAWLWTDHPPNDYGGGFMITQSQAGRIVGHEGFFTGVSSQLEVYVDKGFVVAILGNQDWAAPGLGDAFRGLIAASR